MGMAFDHSMFFLAHRFIYFHLRDEQTGLLSVISGVIVLFMLIPSLRSTRVFTEDEKEYDL
jgi:tetrahydromethanopterin S-methyltransferase subunit E